MSSRGGLAKSALHAIHTSPVGCLLDVLELICGWVPCDFGHIWTVDKIENELTLDVTHGYPRHEIARTLKLDDLSEVAVRAFRESQDRGESVAIVHSGDSAIQTDPANEMPEALVLAIRSLDDTIAVLTLESRTPRVFKQFVGPAGRTQADYLGSVIAVALAARQSLLFRFDNFLKELRSPDVTSLCSASVDWLNTTFAIQNCSLYFIEYDADSGTEHLYCYDSRWNGEPNLKAIGSRLKLGEGLLGTVAATNKRVALSRTETETLTANSVEALHAAAESPPCVREAPLTSHIAVPITVSSHVLGVLEVLDGQQADAFSDEGLLELIADRIGAEYQRINLEIRSENLFAVPNIATPDLELVITGVVDSAMKVSAATHGLFVYREDDGYLRAHAVRGHGLDTGRTHFNDTERPNLIHWVLRQPKRAALVLADIRDTSSGTKSDINSHLEASFCPDGFIPTGIRSLLLVPVYVKDPKSGEIEDLGVLVLMSLRTQAFRHSEIVVTALAEIVSYHIWGTKVWAELLEQREQVVQLMGSMPHYRRLAISAASTAGTVHTANKHVKDVNAAIQRLRQHSKVREDRDLRELALKIEEPFVELKDLYARLHSVFAGATPVFKKCTLAKLVQEVRTYLDPTITDRNVNFKSSLRSDNLPEVRADPILLKVVFINLIMNSIEAGARTITVSGKRTKMGFPGLSVVPAVELTFADDGMGIEESKWGEVFNAFFTEHKKGGTGLGLAVNKEIVDQHKGDIAVMASSPRTPTVFSIRLPVDPDSL